MMNEYASLSHRAASQIHTSLTHASVVKKATLPETNDPNDALTYIKLREYEDMPDTKPLTTAPM